MKKNLSTLCFAGLVALTGLVATGCGSDDVVNVAPVNTATLREYAVIANSGNNSITVKTVNLGNGTSSVLNNQFTTGVGTTPLIVKTHPNINVFYVLNNGSATISQFTLDGNGGVAFLGTVATPPNPTLLAIHPSGGFVYVVGATNTASQGTVRRFPVNGNGTLGPAFADKTTTNVYNSTSTSYAKDADFSFGGGTFHVPTVGAIESFPVNSDGTLGNGVLTAQALATDNVRDIDVRPGQASLVAVVRPTAGNDKLRAYALNNGVIGAQAPEVDPGELTLGLADFASNGQYYVGSNSNPRMFGFNVANATGVLTALATNPMAVTTGARSLFVMLDPSNNFMVSTGGTGDNVLVARFRGQNGEFVGSTADSQSLNSPQGFDFFTFNF